MEDIIPYKIDIPQSELNLLSQKLRLTRLPTTPDFQWTEENGITKQFVTDIVESWREKYSWRDEEARINAALPQFMTKIEVDGGFGVLDVHFVHKRSSEGSEAIPLLFIHGWPSSFLEITRSLSMLNETGFDVVAPSLPGYGFSPYTDKKGFDIRHHAELLNKLMLKLGYQKYVVQAGDWGSWVTRALGVLYPQHFKMEKPDFPDGKEPEYTEFEKKSLDRFYN